LVGLVLSLFQVMEKVVEVFVLQLLDLGGEVGTIEAGKRADLVVLRSSRLLDLVRIGVPAIRTVVKAGRVVVRDGRRAA